jgi:hypothetical protein
MFPTPEQVRDAAYFRWLARHGAHGHDHQDWLAAEQDLLFSLNYQVVVRHRLDDAAARPLGLTGGRRCRFCEQTAPRARFSSAVRVVPEALGGSGPWTLEECDDCHEQARAATAAALDDFTRAFRTGRVLREPSAASSMISIAAYKGFARIALAIMPPDDLADSEDAIEWVNNPDHDLDSGSFRDLDCGVTVTSQPASSSWMALARRVDDAAPMPALLFFLCIGHATFQVRLPLAGRDEDLDGSAVIVPRGLGPLGIAPETRDPLRLGLAIALPEGRRDRSRLPALPAA